MEVVVRSLLNAMLLLNIGGRSSNALLNWFSIFLPRGFILGIGFG